MTRRYPFAPLRRLAELDGLASDAAIARRLGALCHSTVARADRNGLSDRQADRWAIALGFHPAEVWGDAWWPDTTGEVEQRREYGTGSIVERGPDRWLVRRYVDGVRRARVVVGSLDDAERALRSMTDPQPAGCTTLDLCR